MRNQRHSVVAMTGLLIVMLAAGLSGAGCSEREPEPGDYSIEDLGLQPIEVEAPDFTATTLDGGTVTLSSLRGTPVLLNFWAIQCPPCVDEMPYLNDVAQQFSGQAVVLAIDIGDSHSSVEQFFNDLREVEELHMTVPVDTNGQVAALYSVGFTPTTFLIDADGIARYVKVGAFANQSQVTASIELMIPGASA